MSIEFLPGDEAHEPPLPPVAPPRRRWVVLVAAAVVVVLGAVWVATRPAADHPAVASKQHQPVPNVAPVPARVAAACRGVPDCATRENVPSELNAVVRKYLPTTSAIRVHSYLAINTLTGGSLLVQRDINASAGSVSVLISVRRAGNDAREIIEPPPGVGSVVLHRESSGFIVLLQYLAPETVPPTLSNLRLLARDPGLESL